MILINSSPKNALKIFQPFLPIFVPIGIGCLLAEARKQGIKVWHIDGQVESDIYGLVKNYVKKMSKPYIFGFSVLTAAIKDAIIVSEKLKKLYPDSYIIFGGVHPSALVDQILSFEHIDAVIRGEGEKPLIDFYQCVKQSMDFSGVANLSYKKDGKVIHNLQTYCVDNMVELEPFPYDLFDSKKYDLGFVISSRGCPYNCIFCSNRVTTGRRYRYRPAEDIVSELEMLNCRYGKTSVLFVDDNFLVDHKRVRDLIEVIKKRGLHKKMVFNFQARGDNTDYNILTDLYNAGFRSIFFGIETSSEQVMRTIRKGETVAQCVAAVRLAKEIGFHVSATFIYGLPGETYEDRLGCVKLTRELGIDMVRYNNATPYPGTELYEIAKRENRLYIKGEYENFVSVSTFIENPFKKIPFSYVSEGNSEEVLRRDILFSYFSFYLAPRILKTIFRRPQLGVGWFNAGEKFKEIVVKIPALITLGFMLGLKFCQLFYYMVIKKNTAISLKQFLEIFNRAEA